MLHFLCLLTCWTLAVGTPSGFHTPSIPVIHRHCQNVLTNAGLTTKYNETIAHAIHSMTADALKLFNPMATENNHVPTMNYDLKAIQKVLSYAPKTTTGSDFSTMTMNIVDGVLSQIGNSKDGLGDNWAAVERVIHVFHMRDLWHKIYTTAWKNVLANKPTQATCDCLFDVDHNGIKAAVQWIADRYVRGRLATLLNRPLPQLTNSQTWAVWKDRLLHYYTPGALKDVAIYLYCETSRM